MCNLIFLKKLILIHGQEKNPNRPLYSGRTEHYLWGHIDQFLRACTISIYPYVKRSPKLKFQNRTTKNSVRY